MSITILSQKDVDKLLPRGDAEVANAIVDVMAETFAKYTAASSDDLKAREAQSPQRIGLDTDNRKVLFMPSRLRNTTSVKIVSVPTKDGISGLPATIMVMNEETGSVRAVMNADSLTAIRTAAGSGLATRYYADKNAKNLLVFGAGAQGRAHVDMMLAVRPSLQNIFIWNRSQARLVKLVEELQKDYPNRKFEPVIMNNSDKLEQIVRSADIICTCTNSTEPVLFGRWLKPGVHLNCIGSYRMDMHEVDAETVRRADLILVDSIDACKHEAGELVKSSRPEQWVEIGSKVIEGPETEEDRRKITLFKSVGISVQDSAIAGLVLERAERNNIGSNVSF